MSFAVIQAGGSQCRVTSGTKLKVAKRKGVSGDAVLFEKVLLVANGDAVRIGDPYVSGASVEGVIVKQGRTKKIKVQHYHSKTRLRKTQGHRQDYTEVEIKKIA